MNYVAKKPRLNAQSKDTVDQEQIKGHYFQRIDDHEAKEEAERSDRHKWSGFISPSANMKWRMCMNDIYDRIVIKEEKDRAGRHYTGIGTMFHTEYEKKAKRTPGLLYPQFPNVPDRLLAWQLESWPEVVGECPIRGVRFKVDSVLDVNGEIGVFDLKNSFQAFDKWDDFVQRTLPKQENIVQVCAYAVFMEDLNYYPGKQVSWVGLGHQNACNNQPKKAAQKVEFWWPFDDHLRHKTRTLIYHWAKHRRHLLMGTRKRCEYPLCAQHGDI